MQVDAEEEQPKEKEEATAEAQEEATVPPDSSDGAPRSATGTLVDFAPPEEP